MVHSEDKVIREIEEDVKFFYLAQHKETPAEQLLGVISKKVTCVDTQKRRKVYHVVVTVSQDDYDRITALADFCHA